MAAKPWLRDYFKRLAENIDRNQIVNERGLTATVELPIEGWYRGRTLLQALEYDKENVRAQHTIQLGTVKARVDFLLGRDLNRWMLDLKKPGELCDRPKHVVQLQSYLGQEKIALGVLFSGNAAFAYVNPEHEFVSDLFATVTDKELEQIPALNLKDYPVNKVSMNSDDSREMVRFFQMLRYDGQLPEIKDLSRKLAGDYLKRVRKEGKASVRSAAIFNTVEGMLQNPDENFIESIIGSSLELMELRVVPKDIIEMWSDVMKSSKSSS